MLDTISKQSFADITGLAATQANAAAAYSKAVDTALQYGKEASTLAQQAGMLKTIDKAMDSIDKAEAAGKIDSEKAKDLRTSALQKLVGQGGAQPDALDVQKRLKIVDEAAKSGAISANDSQDLSKLPVLRFNLTDVVSSSLSKTSA